MTDFVDQCCRVLVELVRSGTLTLRSGAKCGTRPWKISIVVQLVYWWYVVMWAMTALFTKRSHCGVSAMTRILSICFSLETEYLQHFWWSRVSLQWVIMPCPDYVNDNVVWRDDLPARNFPCVINVLSIEDVVLYFESVTVLEQFSKESAFKVNVIRREPTVAADVMWIIIWMSGTLSWAKITEDSLCGLTWFITMWWHERFATNRMMSSMSDEVSVLWYESCCLTNACRHRYSSSVFPSHFVTIVTMMSICFSGGPVGFVLSVEVTSLGLKSPLSSSCLGVLDALLISMRCIGIESDNFRWALSAGALSKRDR